PDVTRRDLIGKRVPVLWRTVPDDVRDEDLRAVESDTDEELIEQLTGRADERTALLIFVEAGSLAEEEDAALAAPLPRHSLLRRLPEGTGPACAYLISQLEQGVGHSQAIIGLPRANVVIA